MKVIIEYTDSEIKKKVMLSVSDCLIFIAYNAIVKQRFNVF